MKRFFLLLTLISGSAAFSQNADNIQLTPGQKITAISTTTSDTDMGMGMQMKSNSTNTNILSVIAAENKNYIISNTTTKLNLSMDMMGQSTSYDSEKPEDKNSELGKELSQKLNIPDTVSIDKNTGSIAKNNKNMSPERPEKGEGSNPFEGLTGAAMGDGIESEAIIGGAFFIVPKDKKTGESWTDSSTIKNMTTIKTYTIKSIEKNMATITIKGSITGDGETEMQGTNVAIHIDTKSTGLMIVDIKKGLVIKTTNDMDISASMDVMGQSMPITSKGSTSIIYQY